MSEIHVSWCEYYQKIEQLAVKIYESNWQFNQIVCLARGGLRVGDILSRIYQQPLAILAASSYCGQEYRQRSTLKFSDHLTMTAEELGNQILLVDDLVDSGTTLQQAILWLKQHYMVNINEVRTGVIWYKKSSLITPDYYTDYLAENPWIHQPFEFYEQISLAQLVAKYQQVSQN